MRKSATALARRHALINVQLAPYLPTAPERLEQGVRLDAAFWLAHQEYFKDRLTAFREGFKYGIRVPVPARRPVAAATTRRDPADG